MPVFHETATITTFDGQAVSSPKMPKLLLAYACRTAAADSSRPDGNSHGSFGFATEDYEVAVGSGAVVGVGGTDISGSRIANKLFSEIEGDADSSVTDWDLASFDCNPSGFTLDKTSPNPVEQFGSFLALCGSSQFEAYVGTFNARSGAEGAGTRAVTGVGFQPQLVIFLWAKTTSFTASTAGEQGGPSFGFGAASSSDSANQFAYHTTNFYIVGASTKTVHKNGVCGVFLDPFGVANAGAIKANMTLSSFDADGFTVSFDASDAVPDAGGFGYSSDGRLIGFCAMRDPDGGFHVGQATAKTSTGSQAYTGAGFQPDAVLLTHGSGDSSGAIIVGGPFCIGAFDSDSQTLIMNGRTLGGAFCSPRVLCFTGGGTTPVAEASGTSLDADGFTLNWTSTDGTARPFGWIAMKTAGPSTGCSGFLPQIYRRY